jgi:hypothetical protein
MLAPMQKCHKAGCTASAQWASRVLFFCQGMGIYRRRIMIDTERKVCDEHREARAKALLSDRHRAEISRFIAEQGFPLPDWNSVLVEFFRSDPENNEMAA